MDHAGRAPGGAALLAAGPAGAVIGAGLQLQQPALWPAAFYAALAVGCALVLAAWAARCLAARHPVQRCAIFQRSAAWRALVLLLLAGALAFASAGWRAASFRGSALDPALEGRDLLLTGRVAAMPQHQAGSLRFRFAVEAAQLHGQPVTVPSRVLLSWYLPSGRDEDAAPASLPDLWPGDRWRLAVRLKAPHGAVNPHGHDHELWMWEQGLQATGYVRHTARDPPPQRLAATRHHLVEQARQAVRERILARVADPRWAGVVAALAVGDQGAIAREDWEIFRATGVSHLMSISGLHVTLFAWLAARVVQVAWRRSGRLCLACPAPSAARLAGVLLACGYAVFSGWGVPAQRTVCMLATVTALRLGVREWPWPWVWLLACAVVVSVDPWALLQPGFWLSFVAVGVLFASGAPASPQPQRLQPLQPGPPDAPDARRRWRARGRAAWGAALRQLAALLREQAVVSLALTPLTLLFFGQVAVAGMVANLFAIPWVTLLVTPLALAGVAWPVLWSAAAQAVAALAAGLEALAAWPHATWTAPAAPLWAGCAAVAGGCLLALRLPAAWRAMGVPLLLPALLWQPPRPPPGTFELLAVDVGQGAAVIVRTARHVLLYDAGPPYGPETDAGARVLVPLLRARGDRLDLLVLSHRDSDHTGGAAAVLAAHPQARLLASLEPQHPLWARAGAGTACASGQQWEWDGVRFQVLHPAPPPAGRPAGASRSAGANGRSCVLRVDSGGAQALLAGDIERAQEEALVAAGAPLAADWLLVPHHGSRTSSSAAFLAAVAPRHAVVQAGYRNRFGHPAPDVVQRFRAAGIPLARTPHCGAATWRSDRPQSLRCERLAAPRYWRHRPP